MNIHSSRPWRFVATATVLIAGTIAGVSAEARAQAITEIQPGGDIVQGTLSEGDADLIPFRLVEGARLSLKVKADKGSALRPVVTFLGLDRTPESAVNGAFKVSRKGNQASLKNHVIDGTGLYYVRIAAEEGSSGAYTMTTKVKQPRKGAAEGSIIGGETSALTFTAPGNAVATITVKAVRGSAAVPQFESLRDPRGLNVVIDEVRPGRTGFQVRKVQLGVPGEYTVFATSAQGGSVVATAKFKVPKPVKRFVQADDVLALPVMNDVDPGTGARDQVLFVDVDVDFAREGAVVEFRRSPTVVTVPADRITHGEEGLTALVDLEPFQKGIYDVAVINPDGGESELPFAFEVENAVAQPVSISPNSGKDDEVVTVTINGAFLELDAGVALRRGEETIEGTNLKGGGGSLFADFDLRDQALGAWDVVIANPGTEPAVLPGAFTIEPAAALFSMTPGDNRDGTVVEATIQGNGFEEEEMAVRLLPHDGEQADIDPISGTLINVLSLGTMTANFDTAGTDGRVWDLEVTFPGDVTLVLEDAFLTRGPIGSSTSSKPFVESGEAPHSVVYNADRDEFAVAWVELDPKGIIPWWTVVVQRFDHLGQAIGTKNSKVASGFQGAERQHVDIGWDADNDEYLVAWSETTTVQMSTPPKGVKHPRGAGQLPTEQVFIQRLKGSDLTAIGSNVQVTTHTAIPGGSKVTWYTDEFHNFRPQVAWDRLNSRWEIVWMQEFDTQVNSKDDYNALGRSYDPATGKMGSFVGHGVTALHEGDPEVVWDSINETVWVFFNAATSDQDPLRLFVEPAGGGQDGAWELHSNTTSDLADPRVAVDTESERLLLTWTRIDFFTGRRSVEGMLLDAEDIASPLTGAVVIGADTSDPEEESVSGDHLIARPVYNKEFDEFLVTWTFSDGKSMNVVQRHAKVTEEDDLKLRGESHTRVSGSSGREAFGEAVYASSSGEVAIFWLGSLTPGSALPYRGSAVPGAPTWAKDLWFHRQR